MRIKVLNARELSLKPLKDTIISYEDDKIVKIQYDDNNTIEIGSLINNEGHRYQVNSIYKDKFGNLILEEYPTNRSTIFLLPMLFSSRECIGFGKQLISCFCMRNDVIGIYLLYRYDPRDNIMKEIDASLTNHSHYNYTENIKNRKVLFSFNLTNPEKHIVELFLKGKYSSFPEEYKRKLYKFYSKMDKDFKENLRGILEKRDDYRAKKEEELRASIPKELDLLDIPNILKESL